MRVKPRVESMTIRDPVTKKALPPEGGEVRRNTFWLRRLLHRDVVLIEEQEQGES